MNLADYDWLLSASAAQASLLVDLSLKRPVHSGFLHVLRVDMRVLQRCQFSAVRHSRRKDRACHVPCTVTQPCLGILAAMTS